MHSLTPHGLEFLDTAPLQTRVSATIAAPADMVFSVLADDDNWPLWCSVIKDCRAAGANPQGVGYIRYVDIGWLKIEEEFIVWEPGREWYFTLVRSNSRVFQALVEGATLEPEDAGTTHITWRIGARLAWHLRPFNSVMRRVNARAIRKLIDELALEARKRYRADRLSH